MFLVYVLIGIFHAPSQSACVTPVRPSLVLFYIWRSSLSLAQFESDPLWNALYPSQLWSCVYSLTCSLQIVHFYISIPEFIICFVVFPHFDFFYSPFLDRSERPCLLKLACCSGNCCLSVMFWFLRNRKITWSHNFRSRKVSEERRTHNCCQCSLNSCWGTLAPKCSQQSGISGILRHFCPMLQLRESCWHEHARLWFCSPSVKLWKAVQTSLQQLNLVLLMLLWAKSSSDAGASNQKALKLKVTRWIQLLRVPATADLCLVGSLTATLSWVAQLSSSAPSHEWCSLGYTRCV